MNIAEVIIKHRYPVLVIIGFITLLFAWQIHKIRIESTFGDLLPQGHPYIKIHNQYREQLGDPLKIYLMLKVNDKNIYNTRTLQKVRNITDELDAIPGVNHNQVYSIASRKIKKTTVTATVIALENFMDKVPSTEEELSRFKETVRNTGSVYGIWVSKDEKSTLFTAAFIPELVNYPVVFQRLRDIVETESDERHTIFTAGEPMLKGWVFYYQNEMYWIFLVTFIALFSFLYFYFRNLVGMVAPIISTCLGIIWGLGFCGLLGYPLEPLTLVIPLLIAARALSHSVQVIERYFECYNTLGDTRKACTEAMRSIFPPGALGIITDALGILLIAVAPIPAMQKMAYLCSFWAIGILFTGLIFTPLIISFFPPPRNIAEITDSEQGNIHRLLGSIANLGYGKAAVTTCIIACCLGAVTLWMSSKVRLGDINPGSPILWPDSNYNVAVAEINKNFPGMDELYVIIEGDRPKAIAAPEFINLLDEYQRAMEHNAHVSSSISLASLLIPINRAVYGGYPKREILPTDRFEAYQLYNILTNKSAPGDFDRFVSRNERSATLVCWFKDHMGDTIRSAIASAKEFEVRHRDLLMKNNIKIQLASGNIGLLAAVNETVKDSQLLNFFLVMGTVFFLCALTYRSVVAAIILMIPLNLANLITLSIMYALGIGLNINTLPIVSIGVGVGIDYGIYLLSRICEENRLRNEYSFITVLTAVRTTGKAIFFTATTMITGVIFWYFLSSLRFQAEMGLLLAIIMFLNMVGALLLIPSIIYVFKPKFISKATVLTK